MVARSERWRREAVSDHVLRALENPSPQNAQQMPSYLRFTLEACMRTTPSDMRRGYNFRPP